MQIQEAIAYAEVIHHREWREGHHPLPYLSHIFEVLTNLRHVGQVTDDEMLCAAALHDTVESGRTNQEILTTKFGERVASLVIELTRHEPNSKQLEGLSKPEIWQLRSDMLLADIATMTDDAKIIKLADRLSNLREALRQKKGKKLDRYLEQTQKILKIVPERLNPPLWQLIEALSR